MRERDRVAADRQIHDGVSAVRAGGLGAREAGLIVDYTNRGSRDHGSRRIGDRSGNAAKSLLSLRGGGAGNEQAEQQQEKENTRPSNHRIHPPLYRL
jgi:hypothetical protein